MLNADVYSCLSFNAKFVVPCSFSSYSILVPLCITFFFCYIDASVLNSASLLLLGIRPKLMLCMPLSLSGRRQLTSFLLIQWQPVTLQLPCWVMKESLTGNQQVTKVA